MKDQQFVIGVDYGTLSGRAVVVRVSDGEELASAAFDYLNAVMDEKLNSSGEQLPPDWALQDAGDYVEVLKNAVPSAVKLAGIDPSQVIGIATDFTACTMVPVIEDGTPLSQLAEFKNRPHAYVKLWKHHAAQPQADRINETARKMNEYWMPRYGGQISSEWELAKGLQLLEEDPEIYNFMYRFVEAADVAVGNVDAHVTAPAAKATEPGQMVAIMGTSTCHVMNHDAITEVPGMCGVVDGGIVSGLYGYEAGQSGVGDIFAWYVDNQVPQKYFDAAKAANKSIHQYLTDLAADEAVGAHGLVALDWHSGNRSVLVDHELSGLVIGATLTTTAEQIYRAYLRQQHLVLA
jgi:L-ribulokinase